MAALRAMWADVQAGRLPAEPTIEWYRAHHRRPVAAGRGGSPLVGAVRAVGALRAGFGSTWDAELPGYVARLLEIVDRYAPGTSDLVADMMPLSPPGIEKHFGITGGHIHHVDNTVSFDQRMPYATGLDGLYAGSAGAHPAGSVIGAAGHNAAKRILADLGR